VTNKVLQIIRVNIVCYKSKIAKRRIEKHEIEGRRCCPESSKGG